MRKGIILAGGSGSRLYPLTLSVTKQLLPVHDKPMIFYPLSTLLELGVKEILIISTSQDQSLFKNLFGDGKNLGIQISYKVQDRPNGIAEGLIIAEEFLCKEPCVFILGDNLFIGSFKQEEFQKELNREIGATIFSYKVNDPERYGVITLDENNNPLEIIEKPTEPKSNNAITGLYFYDGSAVQIAKKLKPSPRGELEITDVNKQYLKNDLLYSRNLDNNTTWLDAGTIDSLYEASSFVRAIEERKGKKIACLEEIAFTKKLISADGLKNSAERYGSSNYGKYLKKLLDLP
jgi:glucose-1-phosphate thymidylyltransferase